MSHFALAYFVARYADGSFMINHVPSFWRPIVNVTALLASLLP